MASEGKLRDFNHPDYAANVEFWDYLEKNYMPARPREVDEATAGTGG
jgi:hypothetical protein